MNLHNPLPPWQLCFLSQTKTQLTQQFLLFLFPLSCFQEMFHIVWLAPSHNTCELPSCLWSGQDERKKRGILNFTPSRQSKQMKVLLSAVQEPACTRHLSILTDGALAFRTVVNVSAVYQMTQQYNHITLRFKRPNSLSSVGHEGLLFLPSVLYFQQSKAEGTQKPYVDADDMKC